MPILPSPIAVVHLFHAREYNIKQTQREVSPQSGSPVDMFEIPSLRHTLEFRKTGLTQPVWIPACTDLTVRNHV